MNTYDQIISVLQENLGTGAWSIDFDSEGKPGRFIWSDALRHVMGYTREEFPDTEDAWTSRTHPEDRIKTRDSFYEAMNDTTSDKIFDRKYRLRTSDGEYKWFRSTGKFERDKNGKAVRFVGLIINIDEEVKALQVSEELKMKQAMQISTMETQLKIIDCVSSEYITVISLHLLDATSRIIKQRGVVREVDEIQNSEAVPYNELVEYYINKHVTKEDCEDFKKYVDIENIRKELSDKKDYTITFHAILNGKKGNYQVKFVKSGWMDVVIVAVKCIDDIIAAQVKLMKLEEYANMDKLTDFYNRRAYENQIEEYIKKTPVRDFVFIALDINGLKEVNDNLGHIAGDELIRGAAKCMARAFGSHGRVFRVGGDEFAALIFADNDELKLILKDFDELVASWSGELAKTLSIAYGCVQNDVEHMSIKDMENEADKRMYEAKARYYKNKLGSSR